MSPMRLAMIPARSGSKGVPGKNLREIAGLNTGYDRIVTRRTDADSVAFGYYQGDSLLAVDAMNDPRGYMVGKRLIEAGKSPDPALIADPDTDLKALLRG